ncbi:MAG: ABC transporter substrate-binding protein [Anaerolineales bacterium]
MKTLRIFVLYILLVLTLTACVPATAPTPSLTLITIQLGWTHQSNFSGFYAVDRLGYYAAKGLAVSFIEGGPNVSNPYSVLAGIAQFGVTGADDLILTRAQGQPLRALATIYRRSPVVLSAWLNQASPAHRISSGRQFAWLPT